jgi:16S rRNA (uracil1498-N3)-methyltransferase
MYSFFVEADQITKTEICILGKDVNHIKNVLRMKIGEELNINNGIDTFDYHCEISELGEDVVRCHILYIAENDVELSAKVTLFQGLPKSDKMELIIQKCVELGAYEFVPVATKRAVVKLDDKKAKNKVKRWNAIAEAAAKQSKRKIVPEVTMPCSFGEAMNKAKDFDKILIPYENAKGMSETKTVIEGIKPGETVAIFIGPEGGFSEVEIEKAMEHGAIPITLGKRILRTETAGFTTLSWIMYQLEK